MTENTALQGSANYGSVRCLQTLIKSLPSIERLAERGDRVAMAIMIDLKTVLGDYKAEECPMTPRQAQVVRWHLREGYTQVEIAGMLCITQRAVSHHLFGGLRRLSAGLEGKDARRDDNSG